MSKGKIENTPIDDGKLEFKPITTNGWSSGCNCPDSDREAILGAAERKDTQSTLLHVEETLQGRNGPAVSVSEVLRKAGLSNVDARQVSDQAEAQLRERGWHLRPFSEAQAGDIYVKPVPSGQDDTAGIVGKDGFLYGRQTAPSKNLSHQ